MTLLHESIEAKQFDVRVVERNVSKNRVSQADVDKFLKSLPDDAQNAEYVSIADLAADESKGS